MLPGIAVVFGKVPPELESSLLDFGLVPTADRAQLSTALGAIGSTATIAGNVGNALAGAQGLYRLSEHAGPSERGRHARCQGRREPRGDLYAHGLAGQARFIPVSAVSAASLAAAIGPALATIALQMQLSEITGLVRTNIALTSQVLGTIRTEQWAELTGLVATIERTVDHARELGSVPDSLWQSIAGNAASCVSSGPVPAERQRARPADPARTHMPP